MADWRETDVIRIEAPKLSAFEKTYIPQIAGGMVRTFRHMVGPKFTLQYPEEKRRMRVQNYRGLHRLNRDAQGRVACVACFMCPSICPAQCIYVVAGESPWPDREKYPVRFEIDELRCIYCGMCEEVCPVDAIELTPLYELVGLSRAEMIFDKAKLLAVFEETKHVKPRKNPPITDYGLTGGQSRDVGAPGGGPAL